MRVSLPSHVPMQWVVGLAAVLVMVQVFEGTTLLLACTAGAFLVLAALAFNAAGGLQYPSGAYIFFNALLSAGVGIAVKTALGEPLHTNLEGAQYTMAVYTVGMGSVLVASVANRQLRLRRPLLKNTFVAARAGQVGLGCLIVAMLAMFVTPHSIRGTVNQLDRFGVLAILLTVMARVKETGGRRSFTWVAFVSWLAMSFFGILSFSKEAIFGPSMAWAIGACASGYQLSWRKVLVLAAVAISAVTVLTPFSQIGRVYKQDGNTWDAVVTLLSHPVETRAAWQKSQVETFLAGDDYHWFDQPQGILDRLTLVPIDDALIYATDHGSPGSLEAVWSYFVNVIPRYLLPSKPTLRWGNIYAHEIGLLQEEDNTTGISFTPYADAYHTGRWLGVAMISCPMFLLLFFVCDSVTGSVAHGPWALLYIAMFAHTASEGMLSILVYGASTFTLAVIAAQLIATHVAPVLGAFAMAPKQMSRGMAGPAYGQ